MAGDLDLSTSSELRERLTNLVEAGRGAVVVLDLSDVRFIDAHCVGLIVAAWTEARSRGRRLEVDGLHDIPARVFGLLGLEPLLGRRVYEGTARRSTRGRHERAKDAAVRERSGGGADGAG